jgi:uncharacterized protein
VGDIAVCGLAITPVKGTRLRAVDQIELARGGVPENRRFYVIDARDRMLNGKQLGELSTVVADYAHAERRLTLTFPDGRVLADVVRPGEEVQTRFFSRAVVGREVEGAWSAALSDHAGQPLRLVEAGETGAVDRGANGAASLISRASLARLAQAADTAEIDARRFRMLIEIDGVPAHGEDKFVGHKLRIGAARIACLGHVGRCLVTSRHPETGQIDLPTLEHLGSYRGGLGTTEPLPFGIYGRVLEPGRVAVGDSVELEG